MANPPDLTHITSSVSRSYVIPALFLNPILFLHSMNTILSRILAPIVVPNVAVQPPPYTARGPSAQHPHLDINKSNTLCWSYTLMMVGVQMIAFSRVQVRRKKWKDRHKHKKEGNQRIAPEEIGWGMDGTSEEAHNQNGVLDYPLEGEENDESVESEVIP